MVSIDYQDRRPIYEQIVERIQLLIVKGAYSEGVQLPSVRQMASDLSINPNTIQKAYSILEKDGYIYAVKGRGMFVSVSDNLAESKRQTVRENLECLLTEGKSLGVTGDECRKIVDKVYGEGNG